jgi:hypothetical protein
MDEGCSHDAERPRTTIDTAPDDGCRKFLMGQKHPIREWLNTQRQDIQKNPQSE